MISLDREHTSLIIDHCLGLCSPSEAKDARKLITNSDPAAQFHSQVEGALQVLASLPAEPCPDYLAEITIRRLNDLAAQESLAEGPRPEIIRLNLRRRLMNAASITAVAAAVVVVAAVSIRSFSPTHQREQVQPRERSVQDLLPNTRFFRSDQTRVHSASWPQDLSSMVDVYGPVEYYPGHVSQLIELGPPIFPAPPDEMLEPPLKDLSVQPPYILVPDTEQ